MSTATTAAVAALPSSKKSAAPTPTSAAKMKKQSGSLPLVQTNGNTVKAAASSSPSSAAKRLPTPDHASAASTSATSAGATATSTSTTATSNTTAGAAGAGGGGNASPNNTAANGRPARRPHRLNTRTGTTDSTVARKTMKDFPEPYVVKPSHILRKYRKCPPSLKVHLHPTHFRFDQQDGSFSYHSEMRIFIEHLQKGTVPHDMVEEFRKADVPFYDGWLIVRVVDHRSAATAADEANGSANDSDKAFSIHNYTPYITPSPYAPYPTKEQAGHRSPHLRQGSRDVTATATPADAETKTNDAQPKGGKIQPRTFTIALRPTNLSRHMDLVVDAMAPDPKQLNRKQGTANGLNSRTPASAAPPQTPLSAVVPSMPAGGDRGPPPAKKVKMKIDAKDLLEYEARTINATALPIYLEPVDSLEEAEAVIAALTDPFYAASPPSPKSRKRTVAELAADDAYAKEQERFMLIMDERTAAANAVGSTAAAAVDAQAGGALFQPSFEKFNALDAIKRSAAERSLQQKERDRLEKERQAAQEGEMRRAALEQQAEVRRRNEQARQREQAQREQRQMQEAAHRDAVQQQVLAARNQSLQAQAQAAQQAGGIPPNMHGRMMAPAQTSSPVIRQGTPQHAASSPVVNNLNNSAGSPARPGSAVQHAHPGAAMARGPSNQGAPSRNGTPQIPSSTPGMPNATPVMRQPTPSHSISQASPRAGMMAQTPQMAQAQAQAQAQMANGAIPGQQMTPQQMADLSRHRMMQQQLAIQQQQQLMNGANPQLRPSQIAHLQAQQMAQKQQAAQRAGMAGSPAQGTAQYNAALTEHMKQRMQHLQQQGQAQGQAQAQAGQGQPQSSPTPNHNPMVSQAQQQALNLNLAQQAQIMQRNQAMQQQVAAQQGANGGQMMGNPGGQQQQAQLQQQQQLGAGQPGGEPGQSGPQQQRPVGMSPQMHQAFQTLCNQYHSRFIQQLATQRYNGNASMITPQEHQEATVTARRLAMAEMQKHLRMLSVRHHQQQQQQAGASGAAGASGVNQAQLQAFMQQQQQQQQQQQKQMQMAQMQGQAGAGMGINMNMALNGMQGGGGGGANQARPNANGMQQALHYQQQLSAMQRQNQAQQMAHAAAAAAAAQQNQSG